LALGWHACRYQNSSRRERFAASGLVRHRLSLQNW
jgi:hypothetical protein